MTVSHPSFKTNVEHVDVLTAVSKSAALKCLCLDNKKICDLKKKGITRWTDNLGVHHTLELKHEPN